VLQTSYKLTVTGAGVSCINMSRVFLLSSLYHSLCTRFSPTYRNPRFDRQPSMISHDYHLSLQNRLPAGHPLLTVTTHNYKFSINHINYFQVLNQCSRFTGICVSICICTIHHHHHILTATANIVSPALAQCYSWQLPLVYLLF